VRWPNEKELVVGRDHWEVGVCIKTSEEVPQALKEVEEGVIA
jgi:hypothetical protein